MKKQWKFFLCIEFANYLGLQYDLKPKFLGQVQMHKKYNTLLFSHWQYFIMKNDKNIPGILDTKIAMD